MAKLMDKGRIMNSTPTFALSNIAIVDGIAIVDDNTADKKSAAVSGSAS